MKEIKMSEQNYITHKELLTFSNLTNLEWQFVELGGPEEGHKSKKNKPDSTKLRDLLTPGNFYRIKKEKGEEIRDYIYGKDGLGNYDDEEGRKEMAKYASVAMGYKEQGAGFLGNWEVVYAGDRYKVIRDFYDGLLKAKYEEEDSKDADNIPEPGDEEHPLPSRNYIESNQDKKEKLKLYINGISAAAQFVPLAIELSCADEIFNLRKVADGLEDSLKSLDDLTDDTVDTFISKNLGANYKGLLEGSVKSWSLFSVTNGLDIYQKGLKSEIKDIEKNKKIEEMTPTEKEIIKDNREIPKVGFTKELNLSAGTKERDGFRVVAFKNGEQIVIAYRADEDSDGKTLPPDRDLLQLVYDKVYFEHCQYKGKSEQSEIRFVGLNEGADLAAVSSLLYEQPCSTFYTKNPRIKGYIDLTPDDLNSNYQTTAETFQESTQTLASEAALEVATGILLSQGVIPGLVVISVKELLDVLFDLYQQAQIEEFYDNLKIYGLLENGGGKQDKIGAISSTKADATYTAKSEPKAESIGGKSKDKENNKEVRGKITSAINEKDKLEIGIGDDNIPVKIEDAFYIWSKNLADEFEKESGQYVSKEYNENNRDGGSYGRGRTTKTKSKKCILDESNEKGVFEMRVEEYLKVAGASDYDKATNITGKERIVGKRIYNTVKYIYSLQQSYLSNENDITYIYPNLPDGSEVGQEKINIDEEIPQQVEYRPDISQHFFDKEDEYVFLPYINDGKKGKKGENKEGKLNTDGKLNKKYKCKALASMIARVPNILDQTYYIKQSKVDDLEKSIEVKTIRIDHIEVDGDELKPEIIEDNYSEGCKLKCDFKNNSVEKALKQFLTYEDMCAAAFADFHYYKKVYDELEDLIKNHIRVKRKGPANSEIKLGKGDGKKYIGFDDIKSKLRIEGLNLPINKIGELKGSMHIDKGEPQTIKLKMDNQKKLKSEDYNSDSTIEINGKQIGQAKYIVDGVKEQVNDNNSDGLIVYENGKEKLCESTEDIVNLTQFNQKWTIEEYHETIEVEEKDKEDINIRYIHVYMPEDLSSIDSSASKPYLIIRYGHGERYDNVLKIKGFTYKRFDYGIYLPRGHKLKGSLNAEVAVQKHKEFKF